MKNLAILCGFCLVIGIANFAHGAGPCGNISPEVEAIKFAPCISSAQDVTLDVPNSCCTQVLHMASNPNRGCICAVVYSDIAKAVGVDPSIAVTIPKRCKLARPSGTKCGPYVIP